MFRRPRTNADLQRQCDRWNRNNPIGTPVRYHPAIGHPEFRLSKTDTIAYVLGGHTAVLFLADVPGCVALDAVEPDVLEVAAHA